MTLPTTPDAAEWIDTVRSRLLQTWGEQACQRPVDWPEVCERLLATLTPLVDDAVAELARLFADGPPDDPARAIWRAFPRLDREHCAELARLLIEAHGSMRGAP